MILLNQHKKAIEAIEPFIKEGEFYLAGGTAVYYYLNHRESVDLDFFTKKDFDFFQYQHLFYSYSILFASKNTIHAEIEGIKLSFFHHPHILLHPTNWLDFIQIAHLEDILCMKINAIINRGSRRDFVDVYFIMKELSISAKESISSFKVKYGAYNPLVISKAMTYFADADREPELKMIKPIQWEKVKEFFIETFVNL